MSIIRQYNSKRLFSKWLLAVVLLLSLFSFSGFRAQTQAYLDKPQTTLTINSWPEIIRCLSFNRALLFQFSSQIPVSSFIDLSRLHTLQTNIRLITFSGFCIELQTGLFYKVKCISSDSNEEPPAILG